MKRPLLLIAVVLVLGIYSINLKKGNEGGFFAGVYPSFCTVLEEEESIRTTLRGKVLWYETGPEKNVLLLNCGKVYGKVRISVDPSVTADVKIGSRIRIEATCFLYDKGTNPGEFDLRGYYETLGYFFGGTEGRILEASEKYDRFSEGLRNLCNRIEASFDRELSSTDAAYLKSVILGNDNYLEEETKELYEAADLLRLLRMTGFHLTVIGMFIFSLLKKIGNRKLLNTCLTLFMTLPFVFFGSFRPSLIRAWLILAIRLFAVCFKRKFDLPAGASLTLVLLLAENPLLLWNSSLQYWGAVVFSAGFLMPEINAYLKRFRKFWSPLLYFLSFQCVFLPVRLYYQYSINIYGPFLQILTTAVSGIVLFTGISGSMVSLAEEVLFTGGYKKNIFSFVARFLFGSCHYLKAGIDRLTIKISELSGASIIRGCPSKERSIIYLSILVLLIFGLKILFEKRKLIPEKEERKIRLKDYVLISAFLLCTLVFGGFFLKASSVPEGELRIIMIDVGQGDGFLLRTSESEILIDCGSTSEEDVGNDVLLPLLMYYGIKEIDAVFISHEDRDHVSGIETLMSDGRINVLRLISADFQGNRMNMTNISGNSEAECVFMSEGDVIRTGELRFRALWPEYDCEVKDNDASLVLEINYGTFTALFTGDLGGEYESLPDFSKVDLLKTAHHGSAYSTTKDFLEIIQPKIAMISCGRNNPYGHPSEKTLERLRESGVSVFRSDISGAVLLKVKRDGEITCGALAN